MVQLQMPGGVGMFIKESISYDICSNLNLNLTHCEDSWITLDHKNTPCTIGAMYRHPH